MIIHQFDSTIVSVTNKDGRHFTGKANTYPAAYGLHEFDREEDSIKINGFQIFQSDIASISELSSFFIIHATDTWQQAGAYYVRIQAMAKKHGISLRQEFDEHDTPDTKYIVITDNDFPIATARMYPLDDKRIMIGRVVVLPEYRGRGIGTMVVYECEQWAEDQGFTRAVVDSRDNKTAFYEFMGYEITGGNSCCSDTFQCIRMEKEL